MREFGVFPFLQTFFDGDLFYSSFFFQGFRLIDLALFVLGIGVFWVVRIWDKKQSYGIFESLGLNIFIYIVLAFGGFVIGGFYQGGFEFYLMGIYSLMICLACIDYKLFALPDWLNLGLVLLISLGIVFFAGYEMLFSAEVMQALGLVGLFALLRIFGNVIYKREVLGEGDIIFIASLGLLLGAYNGFMSIFWGCVFGGIWAVVLKIFHKNCVKIPLVTFMVLGVFFGFFLRVIYA